MDEDEIVNEVRAAREKLWKAAGGSLEALYEMLKQLEAKEDREVVSLPPRQPEDDATRVA